ncbi:MAG TPA: aldo/keto reductase [Acetobacteraceae bacterium]|nr:aldo/keto reductase [Acetobacteraceae bacterium]
MHHAILGRSGIRVSRLCLGAMMFGAQTDEPTAARIIADARERGVNFIDTADAYAGGRSEEVVGRAIAPHRADWVLATKLANRTEAGGANNAGLSRLHIQRAAEASLKRLGVEAIDVLYWHKEDHATPLEVSVRATADLVRAGKIRHFAVSNHRAWRIAEICRLCDQAGIDRPVASQPYYSALDRRAEVEQLPACAALGLGVVPYSPLARGVLTGKYAPDAAPEAGSRAGRQDRRLMETQWSPDNLRAAASIAEHARSRGIEPAAFAVAWVLRNRLIASVIAGPRTEAQWAAYVAALDVRLGAEDEAAVDAIVTAGHPAAAGRNDPAYPIEGRVAHDG